MKITNILFAVLSYLEVVKIVISPLLVNNYLRLNALESLLANMRCAFKGSLLHLEENDLSTFCTIKLNEFIEPSA